MFGRLGRGNDAGGTMAENGNARNCAQGVAEPVVKRRPYLGGLS